MRVTVIEVTATVIQVTATVIQVRPVRDFGAIHNKRLTMRGNSQDKSTED
ncbi:MAG TPA: hypothetical protein P5341_07875 [Hyphomonas sp.]|nr:hypothetical protein [Hyphomonas sp.]